MNPERPTRPERRASLPEASLPEMAPDERAELSRVWELLDAAAPASPASPSTDAAWAALATRLALPEAPPQPAPPTAPVTPDAPPSRRPAPSRAARPRQRAARTRRRWPALALTLVALAAVALALAWPRTLTVAAPLGATETVALPDGSTVELNSGAQLAYRRGFARLPFVEAATRTVRLRGEAFFDVATGPRPFRVETFNARVEVLGTRFNVRAWPGEASVTTVTVEEGAVQVAQRSSDAGTHETVRLTPGDEAAVGANAALVTPLGAAATQATVWRRGGLAFRDVPLPQILAELERRYAVRLRLGADVPTTPPLNYLRPAPAPLTDVLDDLGRARGFQYRATSDGYELFAHSD